MFYTHVQTYSFPHDDRIEKTKGQEEEGGKGSKEMKVENQK